MKASREAPKNDTLFWKRFQRVAQQKRVLQIAERGLRSS